ncbi:MAG: dihydrofolate reductase [Chloroflexota bacterium]
MLITLIAAMERSQGIGRAGRVPWRLRSDLQRFKALTMGRCLVVGRKTWESIGRPLPGRRLLVVTRQAGYPAQGVEVVGSLEQALELARAAGETETFIGGGAEIYRQALPPAQRIYLTLVHANLPCDAFFPELDPRQWQEIERVEHPAAPGDEFPFTDLLLQRRQISS